MENGGHLGRGEFSELYTCDKSWSERQVGGGDQNHIPPSQVSGMFRSVSVVLKPIDRRIAKHKPTKHAQEHKFNHSTKKRLVTSPKPSSSTLLPGLPLFRTPTTNALTTASTILIKLGNLQDFRPQMGGTWNMVKNLLVCLRRHRATCVTRRTVWRGTRVNVF